MTSVNDFHNTCRHGTIGGTKTAPESVALTADLDPGPNRPHLSERGPAVSIMLPPDSQGNNRGWCAYDLTPHDVAPLLNNFITKFTPGAPDECWLWRGTRAPSGYGLLGRSYRAALLAHRVAFVAFTGRGLADSLTIDHLCNTRLCVNPDHLEPVTLHENIRRKNERLGNQIGGKRRHRAGQGKTGRVNRTRRTPRPLADGETSEQRNRENALRYYYEHRDEILARQRSKPRPSRLVTCEHCGLELRNDGLRRHVSRKHPEAL